MATFGPLSHKVGVTRKRHKIAHQSKTDGNNRGRAGKFVSYCPICEMSHAANPENHPHAVVSLRQKKASCPRGHVWSTVWRG